MKGINILQEPNIMYYKENSCLALKNILLDPGVEEILNFLYLTLRRELILIGSLLN